MRILLAFSMLALAGCSVTVPLGEGGKYGAVGLTMSYHPPFPNILSEQPRMGGLAK